MILKRHLEEKLNAWRIDRIHKPLLIRGARQVGKSFLVEQFGKTYFENMVSINFELMPNAHQCFESLNPTDICNAISIITEQVIVPGKTLLFLDEIQDCPKAIQALRYFKEKMSELHVIGAGSLLELALKKADYRMPVGRIHLLYLYPVSFKEFLTAANPAVIPMIEQCDLKHPLPEAIHNHLIEQHRKYLLVGGMPEAVASYLEENNLQKVQAIQQSIIETYEDDFGHYRDYSAPQYLSQCFKQAPMMIGQQVKYNKLGEAYRSRDLKPALEALEAANVLQRVHATSAQGLPLDATINEKKFKLNFIDVGLVKRFNQLDAELLLNSDIMLLNKGALAEQFVGQEFLAYANEFEKSKVYFWARDGQGTAEVDYVIVVGANIIPVEVKSGKTGSLRSIKQYMIERNPVMGIRISTLPLSFEDNILSVPLYLLSELKRIVKIS